MSLDNLVNSLKRTAEVVGRVTKPVDEEILRNYSVLAEKWEKKGRNIYTLSAALNGFGCIATCYKNVWFGLGAYYTIFTFDRNYNQEVFEGTVMVEDEINPDSPAIDPKVEMYRQVNKAIRIPTLFIGIGFTVKGIIDLVNYFTNDTQADIWSVTDNIIFGKGLIAYASSMYLKDRNRTSREKAPLINELLTSGKKPELSPELARIPRSTQYS